MRWKTLPDSGPMCWKSLRFLPLSSAILNISASAASSTSFTGRPWALKASVAIWSETAISLRSTARSRTISA